MTDGTLSFASLLRLHRRAGGFTQERLAELAGVSVRVVSDLERGVIRSPQRATLDQLVSALELSGEELEHFRRSVSRSRGPRAGTESSVAGAPLPLELTLLVGREQEVDQLAKMLRQDQVRLLTLTGAGGVGKTRLALRLAWHLLENEKENVVWVDLSATRDPDLVLSAMAGALGIRESPAEPLRSAIENHLRSRKLLLVIDNMEQVRQAAGELVTFLSSCPGIKLLVTSRAPLRVRAEHRVDILPLGLPDARKTHEPATVGASPAVALFVQRAQAVRPGFHLTEANVAAVAEICRSVDGLPLALELAAAQLTYASPHALVRRMDKRLQLLVRGSHDAPVRQQTMRDTVEWSYRLLPDSQQALLRQFAVFVGGATAEAIAAVCRPDSGAAVDILDEKTSLVDLSLVRVDSEPDEPRFWMLETVREYAFEQLTLSGEEELLRRRHAAFYSSLTEKSESEMAGPNQDTWLRILDQEQDNLRAALSWAIDGGDITVGLRLAGSAWRFWLTRGLLREGSRWLTRLLEAASDVEVVPSAVKSRALRALGILAVELGDFDRAETACKEGLPLAHATNDSRAAAGMLTILATTAKYRGQYQQATALYEECLALWRTLDYTPGVATTLNNLAIVALDQRAYDRAFALFEESLDLKRKLGDKQSVAIGLNNLGDLARDQGDRKRAAHLLGRALHLAREVDDARLVAMTLANLGATSCQDGDYVRAAQLHAESLILYRKLDDPRGIATSLVDLADMERRLQHDDRAMEVLAEALAAMETLSDQPGTARALDVLAHVALSRGDGEIATRCCSAAGRIREALGAPLPAAGRVEHEALIAELRDTLGDAFGRVWADGLAFELRHAIRYVYAQRVRGSKSSPASE